MIQHEVDHLDGVLILDRTTRDQRKGPCARCARSAEAAKRGADVAHGLPGHVGVRCRRAGAPGGRPHRPLLVVTRPDRPRGRGRPLTPLRWPTGRPRSGSSVPARGAARRGGARADRRRGPGALCVCAFGVLIREPLLSDYEMLNVHPSLLPRWRGAAPVERAIMAGDPETGVSIMRLTDGLDSGPVCLQEPCRSRPRRLRHALGAAGGAGGGLLVRALDERPPFVDQDEPGVTYARKIEAARPRARPDRPAGRGRAGRARAAASHRRPAAAARRRLARRAAPRGWTGPTLAPAGGRCAPTASPAAGLPRRRAGAARDPPAGRPPDGRGRWLRGRPDPALTDFWLDPRLPERPVDELVGRPCDEWGAGDEWAPASPRWAGAARRTWWRRSRPLAADPDRRARSVAAYVAGELGAPLRTQPEASAARSRRWPRPERDPAVLAVIAVAFGHLGEPWGLDRLLRPARASDAAVRDGVVTALAGRADPRAIER